MSEMATGYSSTYGSAPGDVTARAWAPERIVPVQAIELRCELPHTCPECGTSWEPKNGSPLKGGPK